jgi:hypothetical protein|tara:strand:- start:183 stop:581 length:399 start_codon:yes stop_codon:yes gene_type:complete
MYWKYPQLLNLIEFRTIEGVTGVYIYINNTRLLIGYVIESTTGLLTDKTLCIHKFSEKYLNNNHLQKLLNQHKENTCIIDCYSESWGEKKVIIGRKILTEWVNDFLTEEKANQPIIIEHNLDLRLLINLKIH